MPERCFADIWYVKTHQTQEYTIDEFGRRMDLKSYDGGLDNFAVGEIRYEADIVCNLCEFRKVKIQAEGKTKRDALERVRGKVRQFLLNRCESGKNL